MTDKTKSRVRAVTKLFEEKAPKTILDVEALGLKVKEIGNGEYRTVYRIIGLPLVVKVPNNTGREGRKHGTAEYRTIKRITRSTKKYVKLQRYMPKVYNFNAKTGVTLMHHYRPVSRTYRYAISGLLNSLVDLVWPYAAKGHECDIHGANVGMSDENKPVLLDLGYFSDLGKCEDY